MLGHFKLQKDTKITDTISYGTPVIFDQLVNGSRNDNANMYKFVKQYKK